MAKKDKLHNEFEWTRAKYTPSSVEAPFTLTRHSTDVSLDTLGRIHGTGDRGTNILNALGTAITREDGSFECWHRGRLHREDGPAVGFAGREMRLAYRIGDVYSSMRLRGPVNLWFLNGRLHRVGGPAVRDSVGSTLWYLNGKLHRDDGPAIEDLDEETRWWCQDGLAHRDGAPAVEHDVGAVEWGNEMFGLNTEMWWQRGKLHRDGAPAIRDARGNERWYREGKLHRDDGPAEINSVEYPAALENRHLAWFVNGREKRVEYFADQDEDD
jgi:hypothetical protein